MIAQLWWNQMAAPRAILSAESASAVVPTFSWTAAFPTRFNHDHGVTEPDTGGGMSVSDIARHFLQSAKFDYLAKLGTNIRQPALGGQSSFP